MLVLALATASLVACAGPPAGPPGGSAAAIPLGNVSLLRYTCGRFPFGADVFDQFQGAEHDATPAAAALRSHLAKPGPDIDFLPDSGWTLAGMDGRGAEFVVRGGDLGMKVVSVEQGPQGWAVTGWGDCSPRRILPAGLAAASWVLDPAQPVPGRTTRTFEALVTETDCASGQSSVGRVVGPEVLGVNDLVLVTFGVLAREGIQTCPGNPATRVTVDLGEPFGTRTLRDGGRFPPGDPARPGG